MISFVRLDLALLLFHTIKTLTKHSRTKMGIAMLKGKIRWDFDFDFALPLTMGPDVGRMKGEEVMGSEVG